jgi:putative flippase GtrA
MLRLAALLFIVVGASLAGILIVAALVAGLDTARPIVIAAAIGFAAAVPVSLLVARRLTG